MNDNAVPYGWNALEIIRDAVAEYNYPVCFGFPAGHESENLSLILGRKVTLEVTPNGTELIFSPPSR
jgi:muramoyltetrapeptide carboxypeptidase